MEVILGSNWLVDGEATGKAQIRQVPGAHLFEMHSDSRTVCEMHRKSHRSPPCTSHILIVLVMVPCASSIVTALRLAHCALRTARLLAYLVPCALCSAPTLNGLQCCLLSPETACIAFRRRTPD